MKIELPNFFNKFQNKQIIKPLPNYLDDGKIGKGIIDVSSMFIKNRVYYDCMINPIFKSSPISKHYSKKIGKRYYSYALVNGEYKIINYGEQLKNKFDSNKELFHPQVNKALIIAISPTTIPNYTDSYIVDNNNILYEEDDVNIKNNVNLLLNENLLKKYMIEKRPITIAKTIANNNILKFVEPIEYLCENCEVREYLTPLYRKLKIDNIMNS
jgi:hypothetical protein